MLRHMMLMMAGQGEKEESRGGENEESRGSENEENRGGENKESSGNVREKAGKKKKEGKWKSVQQKEDNRMNGDGFQVERWSRTTRAEKM